jgi:hypothetical protein
VCSLRFDLLAVLLLVSLSGCARHYMGRVVDLQARAVPFARVVGSGMAGGILTGEGPFTVRTVADADGKFVLVTSEWPGDITATSPDSKQRGHVNLSLSKPPIVIVVR